MNPCCCSSRADVQTLVKVLTMLRERVPRLACLALGVWEDTLDDEALKAFVAFDNLDTLDIFFFFMDRELTLTRHVYHPTGGYVEFVNRAQVNAATSRVKNRVQGAFAAEGCYPKITIHPI
jgi:hypothetical protein